MKKTMVKNNALNKRMLLKTKSLTTTCRTPMLTWMQKMNFHRINIKNECPMSNGQWPRPKSNFQFCNIRNIFMPLLIQHSKHSMSNGQWPVSNGQGPTLNAQKTIFNFNVLKFILECTNIKNECPMASGQWPVPQMQV